MEKTNEVYSKSTVQTVVVTDDEVWTSCCDVMTGIFDILGAVTLDLLPMGNLGVTAWVGFTLGYDRLPICGYTLVNYPRGR